MVRYSPDPTGRLRRRSYYTEQELDREFEMILETFSQGSDVPSPIPSRPKN